MWSSPSSLLYLPQPPPPISSTSVYKGCANQTVAGGSPPPIAPPASPASSPCGRCSAAPAPPTSGSSSPTATPFTWYPAFPQVPGTQLLYKTCGSGSGDFEARRDQAFAQLQSGVAGGRGFYATSYGSVYALGQCEDDLSASDCTDCVMQAIQKSKVEGGQVFLNKCYHNYYTNSITTTGGESSIGGQTGKTVAIVVGATAAAGFSIICFLFARCIMKKKDDN